MKSAEEVKAQIEKINSRDLRGAISDAVLHTLLWVLDEKDCPDDEGEKTILIFNFTRHDPM